MTDPIPTTDVGPHGNFVARQENLFDQRRAQWLAARAELEALHINDPENDEAINKASDRIDDLARAIMTTYSAFADNTWTKFQIFEEVIRDDGSWTDKKHIWMLGCIKADLMAHLQRHGVDKR